MTEQEWLSATDPHCMLSHIWDAGLLSKRKARLLAAHCCLRVLPLIVDPLATKAVRLCEDDGEENIDEAVLIAALTELQERIAGDIPASVRYQAGMGMVLTLSAAGSECTFYGLGLHSLANCVAWAADPDATVDIDDWASPHDPVWNTARAIEREAQANLLRDMVPNPFRPVPIRPSSLLTPTIVDLAQAIYEARATERLPELAAALEAAGCTDAELLTHLRSSFQHVRGCWALDAILGKD